MSVQAPETKVLNSQERAYLLELQSAKSIWRPVTSSAPQGTVANTT